METLASGAGMENMPLDIFEYICPGWVLLLHKICRSGADADCIFLDFWEFRRFFDSAAFL